MKMRRVRRGPGVSALLLAGLLLAASGCAREGRAKALLTHEVTGNGSNPTTAVRADGEMYIAWIATDETGVSDVFLTTSDTTASPVRVNQVRGEPAPHDQAPAQVAVGPEGNVYVVWQTAIPIEGRRFPASNLRLARSTDGGRSFEPAIYVNDDAHGRPSSHSFHDIAVAPDGTVLVSWIDGRKRDEARAVQQTGTSGMGELAGGTGHHAHGGTAGEAGALPKSEIRIARSNDGGRTFTESVVVSGEACPCCRTSLAVADDGTVFIAWRREAAGDVRDIVIARAEAGSLRFSEAVPIHADGWVFPACPHAGPSLAVGEDGTVHAAWYTGREGRQGLWYAHSTDGAQRFSEPRAVLTGDWVPPSQARLAIDGRRVIVVWEDRRQDGPRLHLAEVTGRGVRTPFLSVSGAVPSLAAGEAGWSLVWADGSVIRSAGGGS
jgi:hypothetical protein